MPAAIALIIIQVSLGTPTLHTQRGRNLDTGEALGKQAKKHGWKASFQKATLSVF